MAKVVILDDEPWSRKVVQSLIEWERLGLELTGEAEDGRSGLELIGRVRPDIVITDMRMPGMDGTELLENLRSRFPFIRILVMSGYDDYPFIRQALKSNVVDYLLKPLDPTELNRILEACLNAADAGEDPRPVSLKTAVIFDKVELLEEYLVIRRLVFGHLLELDIQSVDRSLDTLAGFLRESTTAAPGSDVIRHIAADYTRMLAEFLSLNSRGSVIAEPDLETSVVSEISDLCEGLRRLYRKAIEGVLSDRKQQDQLNPHDVKEHIDRHFRDPISLETVARMFLVSKEHLSRVFRKSFGSTINEYITARRMERARYLISTEGLEIKDAAAMTGYADLAYFYRVFKKFHGITPGQAREMTQSDQ